MSRNCPGFRQRAPAVVGLCTDDNQGLQRTDGSFKSLKDPLPGPGHYEVVPASAFKCTSACRPHCQALDGPFPLRPGQVSSRSHQLDNFLLLKDSGLGPAAYAAADSKDATTARGIAIKIGTGQRLPSAVGPDQQCISISRSLAAGLDWRHQHTLTQFKQHLHAHTAAPATTRTAAGGRARAQQQLQVKAQQPVSLLQLVDSREPSQEPRQQHSSTPAEVSCTLHPQDHHHHQQQHHHHHQVLSVARDAPSTPMPCAATAQQQPTSAVVTPPQHRLSGAPYSSRHLPCDGSSLGGSCPRGSSRSSRWRPGTSGGEASCGLSQRLPGPLAASLAHHEAVRQALQQVQVHQQQHHQQQQCFDCSQVHHQQQQQQCFSGSEMVHQQHQQQQQCLDPQVQRQQQQQQQQCFDCSQVLQQQCLNRSHVRSAEPGCSQQTGLGHFPAGVVQPQEVQQHMSAARAAHAVRQLAERRQHWQQASKQPPAPYPVFLPDPTALCAEQDAPHV